MKDLRKLLGGQPLAILPSAFDAYRHALSAIDDVGVQAAMEHPRAAAAMPTMAGQGGAVAVLPIYGHIAQRRDLFMAMFGGTSLTGLGAALRGAVADPGVKAIVLDMASPGGSVYGCTELAREIRSSRGQKPIVAVVNCLAASAAYWLASSADEIVSAPSGESGSIGVLVVHVSSAKRAEQEGEEVSVFSAGELKQAESGMTSLSDEERAALQARVDNYYGMFVNDVARGRGVAPDAVRKGYGRGATLGATQAKAAGMIDRIATLEETVSRLSSPAGRRSSLATGQSAAELAAELDLPPEGPAPEETDVAARLARLVKC